MGKSQQTYNKKAREEKRLKKRREKEKKREERRANAQGGGLDNMIAYVDENGRITDTPPDPAKKKEIKPENIELGVPRREKSQQQSLRNGKVAFFNESKGYGFIRDLETQMQYFVHVNGLIDSVSENDKVTFELERGLKGMNAVRVKKI